MKPGAGRPAPSSGVEVVVIAAAVVALAFLGVVYLGARLAATVSGGTVDADVGAWWSAAGALASDPSDPAKAWDGHGSALPGPAVYWASTALVVCVAVAALVGIVVVWGRISAAPRVRFGVGTDARQARPSDVRTLIVRSPIPPSGRFLLGRMGARGPLVATENRDGTKVSRRTARRQGSRGSVALIGPTQSGKTVLLSAGMMGWDGPVVALSVKRDLYDVTASARARKGDLAVFDPGASTGLPSARWTPLRGVTTASGALRAGRALAAALPRNGVTGGDYWAQQGESFVSAYMAVAGLSQLLPDRAEGEPLTMQRLTAWAFHGVGVTDPVVNELVRAGLQSPKLEVQLLAEAAAMKLNALHREDPRIRASIYATARLAFEAWSEPSVAHSASLDARDAYDADEIVQARPRYVDLDWLMGESGDERANTLYLIAPDTEFKRLAPVLGGLLGDLREQIHGWDIEGRRLHKPLLFVIDEAAQLELSWLPEEVSTIAGLGGMFVTCWQSKAQIDHHYRTLADAVLSGHRSKIVFTGCDDAATLDWVTKVAGSEHVARRSWSADSGGGRRTVSESSERDNLASPHVVRQMFPGEAILFHGTLPPVHIRAVQWWKDRTLRPLVETDDQGGARPPENVRTCPRTSEKPRDGETGLDRSARDEAASHLPLAEQRPDPDAKAEPGQRVRDLARPPSARTTTGVAPSPKPARPAGSTSKDGAEQLQLPGTPNRYLARCFKCRQPVQVGAGETIPYGSTEVVACAECGPGRDDGTGR